MAGAGITGIREHKTASSSETHRARFSLLEAALPGAPPSVIGVLLEDPRSDRLYVKLRRDLASLTEAEDTEVFETLADDLSTKATEMGAAALLSSLEDSLSNTLRITDRESIVVEHFDRALERLYRQHVRSTVLPFRTHLPVYSLRVAAGKFLENEEVSEEAWEEMPEELRLTPDMFVAHIAGHSMEPFIPDGSLCVFRASVVGSRQGRLVLVENAGSTGTNRYTVKRYRSEKKADESAWKHERIRLESLNPESPSWDLDPDEDKYRIIAEFVRVLG